MKTCPICRKQFDTKAALKQHMESVHRSSGRKGAGSQVQRMSNQGFNSVDPSVRITRLERLMTVESKTTKAVSSGHLAPHTTGLGVIAKFAGMFDKFVIHKCVLVYRGGCGTTRGGMVYLVIDYESTATEPTFDNLTKYPFKTCPVWARELTFPLSFDSVTRYVNGTTVADKVGIVYAGVTSTEAFTAGEVFVQYDITFSGLTA